MSDAWKRAYPKGRANRPGLREINAFLPQGVGELFQEFSNHIAKAYRLGCKPPVFTERDGWVYSFGRYDICLLNHVCMEERAFVVEGVRVADRQGLDEAMALCQRLYADGFAQRFERESALKKERQKQNTLRRVARERQELEELAGAVDPERFNRYRWSPKVSRQSLQRLYDSDAKGIFDRELVDEVGYTLYARCLQGRDERLLIESGKLKCHGCGSILGYAQGAMRCDCGEAYLFRDYMRSFRKENMPSGAATAIFNAFIDRWPNARDYAAKMRLVDWLIHEFHTNLNSGVRGRFVGINLISGTKKQIGELINRLAFGD